MHPDELLRTFLPLVKGLPGADGECHLPLLPGSAQALLAWALRAGTGRTVVLVADGAQSLEDRHQDLTTLAPEDGRERLFYYPAAEAVRESEKNDPDVTGYRLSVLAALAEGAGDEPADAEGRSALPAPCSPLPAPCSMLSAPPLIATCVQALMQKAPSPAALRAHTLRVGRGREAELDALVTRLNAGGYAFETEVVEKGKATLKGGLLDVWPLPATWPLRIEFCGASVESIRAFDPESQRSVARLEEALILPARETGLAGEGDGTAPASFLDYLPSDAIFIWSDTGSIRYHAALYEELAAEGTLAAMSATYQELRTRLAAGGWTAHLHLAGEYEPGARQRDVDAASLHAVLTVPREALQPDVIEQMRQRMLSDFRARAARGQSVFLFLETEGSLARFRETSGEETTAGLHLRQGVLSAGFVSETAGLVVAAEADLYGRRKQTDRRYTPAGDRPQAARNAGLRVADLTDVEPGDLVVHVAHGLGRYLGVHEIVFEGRRQEVLTIEYAEGAKLHVPVSHAHLLSRYVGLSRRHVRLHRLGGRRWENEKASAERAIEDMAAALLETQAQRSLLPGHAFGPDNPWQHEFEASFPYRETPDQIAVIQAVKADMQSSRPMDRLVCGDAGYGKTEVALRAAFKAVMGGKQVAVLVPTTVLAQQHYQTFAERLAAYPVRVETLSRFRTAATQAGTLKAMREGAVDIVIGTHALLQPHVAFKDLGLVIVDEEQRFGVAHKERLKQLRRLVDVLTLTATPIPRTLHLSLTGARDMSLLQTPPRERMAIETIVARDSDKVVRDAILREISREGQVFYLHNRIATIEPVRGRLARVVPEARVRIAHGRMSSAELSAVMHEFAAGEFDVLLCTTIVESGLDIPRANTILIDRADRFGIADLYQLRGRVGRSSRRAYAYLLLPSHGIIDTDARERIGAVRKHSSLSAGFSLALRDLEIRGAGNLLGRQQSGHITAVGFGLYCQLLQRTAARLRGEPLPPVIDVDARLDFLDLSPAAASPEESAFVPYGYIEDERLRIAAYRRLAEAGAQDEVEGLRGELRDRYGPVPPSVERLLKVAELRIACAEHGIRQVETRAGKVMFRGAEDYLMAGARFPRLAGRSVEEKLDELIALAQSSGRWARAVGPAP